MPSHPPETEFYEENAANYRLWRDVTRLFEDFCGSDETKWPEKHEDFKTVMNDVIGRLEGEE